MSDTLFCDKIFRNSFNVTLSEKQLFELGGPLCLHEVVLGNDCYHK